MLNIEKKDFDKLPQLDRIEFRQRIFNILHRKNGNYLFLILAFYGLISEAFLILFSMNSYLLGININVGILLTKLSFLSGFFSLFMFFLWSYFSIKEHKKREIDLEEVESEYFKSKVEVRKR